jgi:hypothetical protein
LQIRKQNTTKPPKINFHQKQQKNKISTKTTITTIARERARRRRRGGDYMFQIAKTLIER